MLIPLYSQEVPPSGELVIIMEDNYDEYEFRMTLTSPICFDANVSDDDLHNISSEYNSAVVVADDFAQFYLTGLWDTPLDNDFGLGRYRVSIIKNSAIIKWFDIDYRTSDLIENFYSGSSNSGDIWLDYDKNTNKLYYYDT
ncbi:MAG: hypothetical protein IH618_10575 [Ignavibacteriaceae bacterium]|nr:hypothetical protein [Ignavibacteriaceae bacterium]